MRSFIPSARKRRRRRGLVKERLGPVIQEQVEIEQPAVGLSEGEYSTHLLNVGPVFSPMPALHHVLTSHALARD